MLAAGRACELYRALACRMGGCACTLRRMAEEESCRARALAGEYYLLTATAARRSLHARWCAAA